MDYDHFYRQYLPLIRAMTYRAGLRDVDDISHEIIAIMIKRDILSLYDDKYTSAGYTSPMPLKSFVAAWTSRYLMNFRDVQRRHHHRYPLVLDAATHSDGEGTRADLIVDDSDGFAAVETMDELHRLRQRLGDRRVNPRRGPETRLADVFDVVLTNPDHPGKAVAEAFSISTAAAHRWIAVMRDQLRESI